MNKQLNDFAKGIAEKTGIEISVFDGAGNYFAGKRADKITVPVFGSPIYQDKKANATLFLININGKRFICRIRGVGETQNNYALLISSLAENIAQKDISKTKEEFFRSVLFGEITSVQAEKYCRKYDVKKCPAFAMLITFECGKKDEIENLLLNYGEESSDTVIPIDDTQCVFIKFIDSNNDDYQSQTEYAEYIVQSVKEELNVEVNVYIGSVVNSVVELSASYLQTLQSVKLSDKVNARGNVHFFKDYVFIKILGDLPKYKLKEYLELLTDDEAKKIFSDSEMIATAEEFLEESLNVSETSRKLYLHRNTLTYRLDKIAKATGLDIRKFSDALSFRLIATMLRLTK